MSAETDCIHRLYQAFAALDEAGMAACYHPEASFNDPAFSLNGRHEIAGMWAMLCMAVREKGRDVWKLEYRDVRVEDDIGYAHWEPHYRFSVSGRLVHNIIDARFHFRDGLIIEHRDSFDFHRWAKQAFGPIGLLMGGTAWMRNKVRTQARRNLERFIANRSHD